MASQTSDPLALLQGATNDGTLSIASLNVAMSIPDLGLTMQQALGTPAADITESEQRLLTYLVDDSGSIAAAGHEGVMIDGVNFNLDAQLEGRYVNGFLASIRLLNGTVVSPYKPLKEVPHLGRNNYSATGGTPLFKVSVETLFAVLAKTKELEDAGITVRSNTLIITDGEDLHSGRVSAQDVATVVRDMLGSEQHIIAGMGIDDGRTDFTEVFRSMGIPDQWIMTPAATKEAQRAAFANFSRTTTASAANQGSFSKVALGGFGGSSTP